MKMTAGEAISEMWSVADKPERMRCFHKVVSELDMSDVDGEKFWSNFWSIWTSSENLFADEDHFREVIEIGLTLGLPTVGLDDDERAALEALDDDVIVYRGACPHNDIGWSWTTDYEKAKWFAGRAFGDRNRIVIKTTVPKDKIVGYLMGRGENEVVIDPQDIDLNDLEYVDDWMAKDIGHGLFHAIQTGMMLDNPEMDAMRARMSVAHMKLEDIPQARKSIKEAAEFATWAELSRANYFRAVLEMLDRLEAGEVLFPKTPEDAVGFNLS